MDNRPSETAFRAWLRFLKAHRATLDAVEAALKRGGLPPLGWYEALAELEHAGDEGLRPVALEKELGLPQYGLSRLLDRIEASGCVARRALASDRRGQIVIITDAGRDLRRRMWSVYADAIATAFGKRLSDGEAETLAALLAKLIKD